MKIQAQAHWPTSCKLYLNLQVLSIYINDTPPLHSNISGKSRAHSNSGQHMENPAMQAESDLDPSLKLALAVSVAQSRRLQGLPPQPATSASACASRAEPGGNSEPDAIKWRRKVSYSQLDLFSFYVVLCCDLACLS